MDADNGATESSELFLARHRILRALRGWLRPSALSFVPSPSSLLFCSISALSTIAAEVASTAAFCSCISFFADVSTAVAPTSVVGSLDMDAIVLPLALAQFLPARGRSGRRVLDRELCAR